MLQIYSLLDRKLGEYGQLVLAKSDDHIRRMCVDSIRGSKSVTELHSEDFDVMHVGEFDELEGRVVAGTPRTVCNVGNLLEANADRR